MEIGLILLLLVLGLIILIAGGEFLVRGASSLAQTMGISPLVVGLTIVAFGTSAPELIVNIFAAISGNTDLAIGNILGSNIANILLILGIAALIVPLKAQNSTVWKEIPLALLAVILVFLFANDAFLEGRAFNEISRSDGVALLSIFVLFMYYVFGMMKQEGEPAIEENAKEQYSKPLATLFVVLGLMGLFLGGRLFVTQSVELALIAGLSEALIGLTVVAIGTSLPELVTSVIAALRGDSDIAIGNIVGSNLFNVFWILGVSSIISPLQFSPKLNFDVAMSIAATFLLFVIMFIGRKHVIQRREGSMFVLIYIGYMIFLVMRG